MSGPCKQVANNRKEKVHICVTPVAFLYEMVQCSLNNYSAVLFALNYLRGFATKGPVMFSNWQGNVTAFSTVILNLLSQYTVQRYCFGV